MSDDERVEELLDRWDDPQDRGERPAPEDLCRDCPELLEPLRRRIKRLEQLDSFIRTEALIDGPAALEALRAELTGGRYRPERFHARGGLGEVFVATDGELCREVALKRQRRDRWFDRAEQARFVAEAEITGRLEHPGVVPVYGLGRDAAGQPYYVMRLIRGQTLEDAIHEFHRDGGGDPGGRDLAFQKLLRHFLSICQTAAYAHSRGVVHRDIKPRNVMLGEYGEALVVDWGLARVIRGPGDAPPARAAAAMPASAGQTAAGVVKGSPAYMSPEQAEGRTDAVGPASDIYSLGATLYHLLAGRPPIGEESLAAALAAVRAGRFSPPRQVEPLVPPALEAVCLKAMKLSPEDRYAGARELAEDVERFLADEPVSAWREPWAARARRWVKRHRTLVAVGAVSAAVALTGLVLLLLQQRAANKALARKHGELTAAYADLRQSNDQVEQNFRYARAAVREIAEQAIGNPLLQRPGMLPVQQALLRASLSYYRNFIAAQRPDDPEVQAELAFAHYAVAFAADQAGEADEAAAGYRQTLAIFGALPARGPEGPRFDAIATGAGLRLGLIECRRGETDSGLAWLEGAVAAADRFARARPDDPNSRVLRLSARLAAHQAIARAGRADRAGRLRSEALALMGEIGDQTSPALSDELRAGLAIALNDFGTADMEAGRFTEAALRFERAGRLCDEPVRNPSAEALNRLVGYLVSLNQAEVLSLRGRADEALRLVGPARARLHGLAAAAPDVLANQLWAARASYLEGRMAWRGGLAKQAERHLAEARVRFLAAAAKRAPDPEALEGLEQSNQLLGVILRDGGQPARAAERLAEARRGLDLLRRSSPANAHYRSDLAAVANSEGTLALTAGDPMRAEAAFEQARALLEDLMREQPDNPRFRHYLAVTWGNIGRAKFAWAEAARALEVVFPWLGRALITREGFAPKVGVAWLERSLAALEALVAQYADAAEFVGARDVERFSLGSMLTAIALDDRGLSDMTVSLHERARGLLRAAARAQNPPKARGQYEEYLKVCGTMFRARALDRLNAEQFADSVRLFATALSVWEELAGLRPDDSDVREMLPPVRMGTAIACLRRARTLDPTDRAELRRVLTLGMAAFDRLPPEVKKQGDIPAVGEELKKRLDALRP